MARRFAKVSEEEIKTAFFYPSDLVNTKDASRLGIYPPLFTSPSGDSCILFSVRKETILDFNMAFAKWPIFHSRVISHY